MRARSSASPGIDGNGQTDLVYALTGLEKPSHGKITLEGHDITHASIRKHSEAGMSHIPEDRHKHGLILDFTLEQNMVLQRFEEKQFQNHGFIRFDEIRKYAEKLIEQYDVRSGQGADYQRAAACPAATSRRPSWPGRSTGTCP